MSTEVEQVAKSIIRSLFEVAAEYEVKVNVNKAWGHSISIKKKDEWER